ncbi:MAG: alpha-amylase [Saprospiraceae bacterium]|nr:alpha-amylase [Saprospiraceae bacterium]
MNKLRVITQIKILLPITILLSACTNDESEMRSADKVFHVQKMNTPLWERNATIYEVDVRNYTKEGTFKAFSLHLPRLQKMGITTICFNPIFPIGFAKRRGALGNPYSIADFTKVNPELGSFEDFRELTLEIQDMGMHVLLDWVGNQTSWDHHWVESQPQWYVHRNDTISHPYFDNKPTHWTDVAELNYESESLRSTMIESMKFWLRSADVDGFRCHAAQHIPDDFWTEARPALERVKQVFMVADAEGNPRHYETCFQATHAWSLYQLFHEISRGNANGNDLRDYVARDRSSYPAGYFHINFTATHHVRHQKDMHDPHFGDAQEAMAVLAMTMEGMPSLYNGLEAELQKKLPLYDKGEIKWDSEKKQGFYIKLIQLKKFNKALFNGKYGGQMQIAEAASEVFAFLREKDGHRVAVIVNCSGNIISTPINLALNSLSDLFTGKDYSRSSGENLTMEPWQYLVLANPSITLQ